MSSLAIVLALAACNGSGREVTLAAPSSPAAPPPGPAPVQVPPVVGATDAGESNVRRRSFEDLREAWPDELCGVATSGVPTAVRVRACNCGEELACRVRHEGGVVHVEVREDPATMTACDDCLPSYATCPSLQPMPAGRATISVNGRAQIQAETDPQGALPPGRCWDLRIVRPPRY